MNILHTETLFNWGGEQNKVINEMLAMHELGHNVMLLCNPDSQIASKAKELNFKVFEHSMHKKNYHKTIPFLHKTIKENNINLVISHGSTDSWICAVCSLWWRKSVIFVRERHNLFTIKSSLSKFAFKHFYNYIFYISHSVGDYLRTLEINENKLIYMPSCVDVNAFSDAKSELRQEIGSKFCIGTFSSLYEEKGAYDLAILVRELCADLKDFSFIFAGNVNDNTKAKMLKIMGEEAAKKAIFTGFRQDKANVIKACDVFVFASHSEGLGTALIEAMSAKRAIVVYDKAPMNKLILNEIRGLCAAYKNPLSLKYCVLHLLNQPQKAQTFAQNAHEYALQNYDKIVLKNHIKNFLDLLNATNAK